jgi:hypothetical protein
LVDEPSDDRAHVFRSSHCTRLGASEWRQSVFDVLVREQFIAEVDFTLVEDPIEQSIDKLFVLVHRVRLHLQVSVEPRADAARNARSGAR